ncbi:MAG: hypothetical protein H0T79_24545 [Deltaproteobacteria bacterium]|nr:hypothetical protein [Deltaproteobacteria bacterium]
MQRVPARASWLLGDRLIVDAGTGIVRAYRADGTVVWTWRHATSGARYGVATVNGLLLHDDRRAHLLDRDGSVITSFAVEDARVAVASDGTVYVKSAAELWIVRATAQRVTVRLEHALVTTCGAAALLAGPAGQFELVAPDHTRHAFTANDAAFSVVGTIGGPYVVEPERIRVARFVQVT